MKRKIYLYLILVFLIFAFASCGKKNNQKQENTVDLKLVDSTDRLYIEADSIAINSLSEDEIKDRINSYDNLKTSDNFYINIPESAPVLEFVSRETEQGNWDYDEAYKDFIEIYEYLFPDHEFDEKFFSNNGMFLTYYEGEREFEYMEDYAQWDNDLFLRLSGFMAWGEGYVNKGKIAEMGLNVGDFEFIGLYSPYSTETFKLADKETLIDEAVTFFENYVNGIPYPEKNLEVVVADVGVYKLNDDTYGYYFMTTAKNHGIIFDYCPDYKTTFIGDDKFYCPYMGEGFMIESNDVAYIYNYNLLTYMDDVQQYNSIFPIDDAIKIISDSLTDSVEFKVLKAELVYTLKSFIGDDGYTVVDDGRPRNTIPCWKLTLYNENDEKFYDCYVNAKDGTFRYVSYTTPWHELIKEQLKKEN